MTDDKQDYKPAFQPYAWSDRDRRFLAPFVTNPESLVVALRNLPPEIVGALCSRASRAAGSLTEVLLKEYIYPIVDGEDKTLATELDTLVQFLTDHGFTKILNNQRAQAFYAKWLSQYGDDSIAQLTGSHIVFWGISQVAMKFIQDQRVGLEPIEKSTRYVNFSTKVSGHYLYYTPKPDLEHLNLLSEYETTLNHLFDTYAALLPRLMEHLRTAYEEKESILEKKAFDTLRGLLPMATLGQVAFRGNAQAFEYLVNRSAKHPLGELRWISGAVKEELDREIPSLLLRVEDPRSQEYQAYLNDRYSAAQQAIKKISKTEAPTIEAARDAEVRLVEADPEATEKILAGIIFHETHRSWENCYAIARNMDDVERRAVLGAYAGGRTARWQKIGRAFEQSYLRFDIVMDIGAYRDLHRHRMMTQERQRFSTHHGYGIPQELRDAGLDSEYCEALDRAATLFEKLEPLDAELAQYVVPLAYRVRFEQWQNFRELFWESELRTISQGHPDYRAIEHKKFALVRERFPLLAEFLMVDTADYAIARRGTEEKIKEKEEMLVERLRKKSDRA